MPLLPEARSLLQTFKRPLLVLLAVLPLSVAVPVAAQATVATDKAALVALYTARTARTGRPALTGRARWRCPRGTASYATGRASGTREVGGLVGPPGPVKAGRGRQRKAEERLNLAEVGSPFLGGQSTEVGIQRMVRATPDTLRCTHARFRIPCGWSWAGHRLGDITSVMGVGGPRSWPRRAASPGGSIRPS